MICIVGKNIFVYNVHDKWRSDKPNARLKGKLFAVYPVTHKEAKEIVLELVDLLQNHPLLAPYRDFEWLTPTSEAEIRPGLYARALF